MASTTTTKKSTTTTKAASNGRARTRLYQRDLRIIAKDTGYALAGIANDAADTVRALPQRLIEEAPKNVGDLRETVASQLSTLTGRIDTLRQRSEKELDRRYAQFERTFDAKVASGKRILSRKAFDDLRSQAKTARSQVKGAVTSLRKTADQTVSAGVDAGLAQADKATSQVKAAVTSVSKTADAVVEAGKTLVS